MQHTEVLAQALKADLIKFYRNRLGCVGRGWMGKQHQAPKRRRRQESSRGAPRLCCCSAHCRAPYSTALWPVRAGLVALIARASGSPAPAR